MSATGVRAPAHVHCGGCGATVVLDTAGGGFLDAETRSPHRRCEPVTDGSCDCGAWIGLLPNGKRVDYLTGQPHACRHTRRSADPHDVYELAGVMADERRGRR